MTMANKRKSDRIDKVARARKLLDSGLTHVQIAVTLQMSHDQVQRCLRGYKPIRDRANVAPAPYYRGANWQAGL